MLLILTSQLPCAVCTILFHYFLPRRPHVCLTSEEKAKFKAKLDKQQVPHDNALLQSKLLRMKEQRRAKRALMRANPAPPEASPAGTAAAPKKGVAKK